VRHEGDTYAVNIGARGQSQATQKQTAVLKPIVRHQEDTHAVNVGAGVLKSASVHPYRFVHSPSSANWAQTEKVLLKQGPDKPLLFLAVMTARGNSDRRKDVQNSWWRHPSLSSGTVKSSFFVGEAEAASGEGDGSSSSSSRSSSLDGADELVLAKEMAANGNFVKLPVPDTYTHLSRKTGAILDWFAREKPARFLVKVDDDTFPHLDRLLPMLHNEKSEDIYMGLLHLCTPVKRSGRWPEAVYKGDIYPEYMNGPAYILSSSLVDKIVSMEDREFLSNEDAGVGVWIDKLTQAGLPVDYLTVEATVDGCTPTDVLTMGTQLGQMPYMWNHSSCFPGQGAHNFPTGISDSCSWLKCCPTKTV